MKRAVLAWLCLLVLACGGNSPTGPSGDVFDTSKNNLAEAPANAHTVSVPVGTKNLTIKFWFEYNPPRGSSVSVNQTFSITFHCRHSALSEYGLVLQTTASDATGAITPDATLFLSGFDSAHTSGCHANDQGIISGVFQDSFKGLKQAHIQAWLQYWPPGASSPHPPVTGRPNATVIEIVGWTI